MTMDSITPVRLILAVIGGSLILRVAYTYIINRRNAYGQRDNLQRHRLIVLSSFSVALVAFGTALILGLLDMAIAVGFAVAVIGIVAGLVGVIGLVWLFYRET